MPADATSASAESFDDIKCPAAGEPRSASDLLSLTAQPIANSLRWLRARLEEQIGSFAPIGGLLPLPITSANATADTLTLAGHGLSNGDVVRFRAVSAGAPPAPLAVAARYYVVSATGNTFKLALTSGGSAIDISGALSGSVYVVRCNPHDIDESAGVAGIQYAGTTGTISPVSAGKVYFSASVTEPAADGVLSLDTAAPFPGKRWRLRTALAYTTHKVQIKSLGGSVQCTFPASGASWAEFVWDTTANSGWILEAWGGATTVP
jgi:hypothetical protein